MEMVIEWLLYGINAQRFILQVYKKHFGVLITNNIIFSFAGDIRY